MVEAKYRTLEGRQSQSIATIGPDQLHASALAPYAFMFPGAKIGGTVT